MSDVVYGKERRIGVSVDAHADLLKERDDLRAEVERLRAALKWIDAMNANPFEAMGAFLACKAIARVELDKK